MGLALLNVRVLSLNPGSSGIKFGLFENGQALLRENVEGLGSIENSVREIISQCPGFDAVGTRVVHGGPNFAAPIEVTPAQLDLIRALAPLAPLHNLRDVQTIESVRRLCPEVPIVAVFDTAFHHGLPTVAKTYAIPIKLAERHQLRRYGFHGISYRYVSRQLQTHRRLIVCHLGSGASVCAIRDGVSIETSMGFTPLEGLVMGTRSGDIDPGLVLFLARELRLDPDAIDHILNHESGLAGLSQTDGDLRKVEALAEAGDAHAQTALEIFAYRVSKYIGAYAVALEGLDAVAFCGGIGERSTKMRHRICRPLRFLGLEPNEDATASSGPVAMHVVPTDEEAEIARETVEKLLGGVAAVDHEL